MEFRLPNSPFWTATVQSQTGFNPGSNHLVGGNRGFDANAMQAEILTQITYPTGGFTQFKYQPNSVPVTAEQFKSTALNPNLYVSSTQTQNSLVTTFSITQKQTVQFTINSFISSSIKNDIPSAQTYGQILNASGTVIGQLTGSDSKYFSLSDPGTYTLKLFTNVASGNFTGIDDIVTINSNLNYSQSLGIQNFDQMVGGLRISNISDYDGITPLPLNQRNFVYGSGFVINPIDSLNDYITTQGSQTANTSTGERCDFQKVTRNSSTKYSLGSIQGGVIGYGLVTTLYGPTGNNGKTVSQFSNEPDNGVVNSKIFPYPPTDPREWQRGLLLSQTDFSVNQKVKHTTNAYHFQFKTQVINFAAGYSTIIDPYLCPDQYHNCGINYPPFNISSEQVLRDSTIETMYSTLGTDSTTSITRYYYDNVANTQPDRIVTINSKKNVITTYNRTAIEVADINNSIPLSGLAQAAIDTMLNRNMVSSPVESETYLNSAVVNKMLINFQVDSNLNVLPHEILSQAGNASLQSRILINNYDVYGNILDQRKTGGSPSTYLYGYINTYPIAEISSLTYNQVLASLGATAIATFGARLTASKSDIDTFLAPLRAAYPGVKIRTYTYDPLVGVTSMTDEKAMTTYYEYDGFQRLVNIKNNDGNIVKHYCYNYANQGTGCGLPSAPPQQKTYSSAAQSGSFTAVCGVGYQPISVPFGVVLGQFTSTVSQADADQQATTYFNSQGQINANNTGCKFIFQSAAQSGSFTAVCGTGYQPTSVPFVVVLGQFTSTVSQADADQQAITYFNSQGQINANNAGCKFIYKSAAQSGSFMAVCGVDYQATTVPFSVILGQFTSTVSQGDADQQAITFLNTQGQLNANNTGCKPIYYSEAQSVPFIKNDCSGGASTGSTVNYPLAARAYNSLISVADANQKALAFINANGQANANTNGVCLPYIIGPNTGYQGVQYSFTVGNISAGESIVWTIPSNVATISNGQGTGTITIQLKNIGGSTPTSYTISVAVTAANGQVYNASFASQSVYCPSCPKT